MGRGGETVEPRPGHSGGLGKPGGDEYPITRNICGEYLVQFHFLYIYLWTR